MGTGIVFKGYIIILQLPMLKECSLLTMYKVPRYSVGSLGSKRIQKKRPSLVVPNGFDCTSGYVQMLGPLFNLF